jgi:hypothetical protein
VNFSSVVSIQFFSVKNANPSFYAKRVESAYFPLHFKFDMGNYQIQIADEDIEKTRCHTRYGSYEFLVLPFRLCNAPSTFTTLINTIFQEEMDDFVIIYIDDILVYSKMAEDHAQHLEVVVKKLRNNKLCLTC